MVADYLFELSHDRSQGLVASIQRIAQLGARGQRLLIGIPSLGQEVDVFHEGFRRTAEPVRRLGIELGRRLVRGRRGETESHDLSRGREVPRCEAERDADGR